MKKGRKWLIWELAGMVTLLLITVLICTFLMKKAPTTPNTSYLPAPVVAAESSQRYSESPSILEQCGVSSHAFISR